MREGFSHTLRDKKLTSASSPRTRPFSSRLSDARAAAATTEDARSSAELCATSAAHMLGAHTFKTYLCMNEGKRESQTYFQNEWTFSNEKKEGGARRRVAWHALALRRLLYREEMRRKVRPRCAAVNLNLTLPPLLRLIAPLSAGEVASDIPAKKKCKSVRHIKMNIVL